MLGSRIGREAAQSPITSTVVEEADKLAARVRSPRPAISGLWPLRKLTGPPLVPHSEENLVQNGELIA